MLFIDSLKLIKLTFKRFFTIVAIVLIGVSFMMGLMSTEEIMLNSVDSYNKKLNLQDFQIYSNFGFCDDDIKAIKQLKSVKDVYPSKQIDVYCKNDCGETFVSRIREINSDINKFNLIEGRLPISKNEVVVLCSRTYSIDIGEKLHLYLEDDNITDSISINDFKVVGIVESSEFLSKFLSTSNLNNLDLEVIIYANNDIFISDYYTCVYYTLQNSNNFISGSNEYFEYVESVRNEIETLKNTQESYNRSQIIKEAQEKIDDAKQELYDEKEEGERELDKANKKLIDAWNEIIKGQKEIDDGIIELEDAQDKVYDGYLQLNNNKSLLANSKTSAVEAIILAEPSFTGQTYEQINTTITNSINIYNQLIESKNHLLAAKTEILNIFPGGVGDIDAAILAASGNLELVAQLEETKNNLLTIENNLLLVENNINTNFPPAVIVPLQTIYTQLSPINDAIKQINAAESQLIDAQDEIDNGWFEIENAKKELEDGKRKYYDGKKEYFDSFNEFNEKIADAENEISDAEQEIADFDDAKWIILDRDSHYSSYMYKNNSSQMGAIGIVLPFLFFLVAALVCMTTMTRLVDEQRGQNGIYVALGYSKGYVIKKYLLYVLIASLLGSIPGIFLGMSIFPTVIYNTWRLMYVLPPMQLSFPLLPLVLSFLSFSTLMMFVTYIVLKNSLIERPAQLMRPKSPKTSKAIFLEKINFIWERLSFTSKITARNLIRYKSRFFMTVIGVAGCIGLLVLGWGIKDSISDIVNIQYGNIFNYDYIINIEYDESYNDIISKINNDPNIRKAIPVLEYSSKITFDDKADKTINAIVLTPNSFANGYVLNDHKTGKKMVLDDSGVLINEKFAINNDIKVGDYINFESRDGICKKVKVSGIGELYFQHYLFISEKLYVQLFNESIEYTNIDISYDGDEKNIYDFENEFDSIKSINDFSSFIDQFNTMINALDLIIAVIILTAGALELVVLINLIQVNISERIREIATFKVLGFKNNEINAYIFKEIIILTLIGSILGMPLGKIEEKFVLNVINMEMIMFPNNIKFISYIYSFVITMFFTIIVLLFTRRPLRKINMIESLKSVE